MKELWDRLKYICKVLWNGEILAHPKYNPSVNLNIVENHYDLQEVISEINVDRRVPVNRQEQEVKHNLLQHLDNYITQDRYTIDGEKRLRVTLMIGVKR